jgi:hypothetical protein
VSSLPQNGDTPMSAELVDVRFPPTWVSSLSWRSRSVDPTQRLDQSPPGVQDPLRRPSTRLNRLHRESDALSPPRRRAGRLTGRRRGWQSCRMKSGLIRTAARTIAALVPPKLMTSNRTFDIWERHGYHVVPTHFYEPVPNVSELPEAAWASYHNVDMNDPRQLALAERAMSYDIMSLEGRHGFTFANSYFYRRGCRWSLHHDPGVPPAPSSGSGFRVEHTGDPVCA